MKNCFPYIYDFLEIAFDSPEIKKSIRSIILFGSVATGDYDKESDIDIFVDVASEDAVGMVEAAFKEAEKRFYAVVEKRWSLLGMEMPIKYIVGLLDSYMWEEIKSEVISTGITLYGKYAGVKGGLKHFSLFSYDMSKLDNRKKASFIRNFFGYAQKRGKKVYKKTGYLQEIGGSKLGKNCVLIPIEKSRDVQKFFTSVKLTPEIREIWIKG